MSCMSVNESGLTYTLQLLACPVGMPGEMPRNCTAEPFWRTSCMHERLNGLAVFIGCLCACLCTYRYTDVRSDVHANSFQPARMYLCAGTCVCTYMYLCVSACLPACLSVRSVCASVCTCVHMYMHYVHTLHTYVRICTHTHMQHTYIDI